MLSEETKLIGTKVIEDLRKQMSDDIELLQKKDMWKKEKAVDYLDVSTKTFERWKKNGDIRVKTIGGTDFVFKSDIMDKPNL